MLGFQPLHFCFDIVSLCIRLQILCTFADATQAQLKPQFDQSWGSSWGTCLNALLFFTNSHLNLTSTFYSKFHLWMSFRGVTDLSTITFTSNHHPTTTTLPYTTQQQRQPDGHPHQGFQFRVGRVHHLLKRKATAQCVGAGAQLAGQ